jgi:predicted PurR-regulated permease PerM
MPELFVDFLRAQREKRFAFVIRDPKPVDDVNDIWNSMAQIATIGIFLLLVGTLLFFARALLLPIFAAVIISTTLAPLVKRAAAHGIPNGVTAFLIVGLVVALAVIGITLLAGPVSEWIGRAPEIGAQIKSKLYVLDTPLAKLHELQTSLSSGDVSLVKVDSGWSDFVAPAVTYVTPALSQIPIFLVTLIFLLIGHIQLRNFVISLMPSREAKLRCLRIANDIEQNLARHLATVTLINCTLGVCVALGCWAIGLPNPAVFGLLAMILNYVPYIGPATMTFILFSVGLVVFPSLGHALIAPAGFVGLATLEGQFIMPMIVGRRLTLNPLAIFLMVAFWAWLWGPIGAFLAIPLSIVGLVTANHLFPDEDAPLLPE